MNRTAKIALVNLPLLPPDAPDRLDRTLLRMKECVDQAATLGNDLVAFPEICSTLGAAEPWQFQPLDGPTVSAMSRAARECGLYVVCPVATMEGSVCFNSSVLIDRDGRVAGVYHKNFPTHGELDIGILPGTETPVFETDFGRVGLSICFDLNYWEVGSSLCANRAELVLWSSMWPGGRMLTKWAMEFGFYMGAIHSGQSTFVDLAGREIVSIRRDISDRSGSAPVVCAELDLDRRLLHHDGNLERLERLFERYGGTAAEVEWLSHECLVVLGSQLEDLSTDALMDEFELESMRDYLARVRVDRRRALQGTYDAPTERPVSG